MILLVLPIKVISETQHHQILSCTEVVAIGESIKGIDKMTRKQLLPNYPEVDWKGAMGIRDIIAHHYFDIDESIVFDVVKNKLPGMLETIYKMIEEL